MAQRTVLDALKAIRKITLPQLEEAERLEIVRSQPLINLKVQELTRGENDKGGRIGYYRNPNYRLFKQQVNPLASGTVDLILTGQFTRGLFVESIGNGLFQFDSSDDKAPELFQKYDDIRGIQNNVFIQFQKDYIVPAINKEIKQRLGL